MHLFYFSAFPPFLRMPSRKIRIPLKRAYGRMRFRNNAEQADPISSIFYERVYRMYKKQRNYENFQRAILPSVGEYGIPIIEDGCYKVDNWISFNFARTCEEPDCHGIHFFVDDYQFLRLWTNPENYIPLLQKFQAVCSPDFSTYTDFPKALQIYNHYRKHWLGAYWQANGINVIPTISWSDEGSFSWCFDGEPVGGMVAVSTVGTQGNKRSAYLFEAGYNEMKRRLKPVQIVLYGSVPAFCEGDNIIPVKAFQSKWC